MSEILELKNGVTAAALDRALVAILQGEVIVAASEHAYMYFCDAFNVRAVEKMHVLRNDKPGTAAQVMVGNISAVSGVARDFDSELQAVAEKFWPGLLTLQLAPHNALTWDLGDKGSLGEFALRIPAREFILALLKKSGPLAAASASIAGGAPSRDIDSIPALASELGLIIDEGALPEGGVSTVLRRSVIGIASPIELFREGAISREELLEVLPDLLPTTDK